MMKFEVIRKETKETLMSTHSAECIPFSMLKDMEKDGYKFKIDGKVMHPADIIKQYNNTKTNKKSKSNNGETKVRSLW